MAYNKDKSGKRHRRWHLPKFDDVQGLAKTKIALAILILCKQRIPKKNLRIIPEILYLSHHILRWRITRRRVASGTKGDICQNSTTFKDSPKPKLLLQFWFFASKECQKKSQDNSWDIFFWCFGDVLSSRTVASQVFSAIGSLTSVFGMRTGEPSLHCHQTRLMIFKNHHNCIITFVVYFSAFAFISTNEELIL